jgi:hypothetical protein
VTIAGALQQIFLAFGLARQSDNPQLRNISVARRLVGDNAKFCLTNPIAYARLPASFGSSESESLMGRQGQPP